MEKIERLSPEISPAGKVLAPRSAISGALEGSNAATVALERTCAVEMVEIKPKTRKRVQ